MKIIFALLILVSAPAMADGGKVYYYRFDMADGYWGDKDWSADHCSRVIARFLTARGLDEDCVDLREEGLASESGTKTHHEWIFKKEQKPYTAIGRCETGVILNKPLTDAQQELVKNDLCNRGGKKCHTEVVTKTENISDLAVTYSAVGSNGTHGDPVKIGAADRLPRFSDACKTGRYEDAWNNSADTSDARTFLQKIGINPDQVMDYGVSDKAGEFWEFGFPNHQNDGKINEAPAQPAPEDGTGHH